MQPSEAQKAHQLAFRDAIFYAQSMKGEQVYRTKADGTGRSPFYLAVAAWFHAPEFIDVDLSDWNGLMGEAIRVRYQEFLAKMQEFNNENGKLYRMGVGQAGMWYRFGKSGSLEVETHAELAHDSHFVVYCSAPDYGQGITTVMVQLAADSFGIPRECIELVNADTGRTPDSGTQGDSRATYFIGSEETRPEYLPIFVTGAHLAQVIVDMETGLVEVRRLASRTISCRWCMPFLK